MSERYRTQSVEVVAERYDGSRESADHLLLRNRMPDDCTWAEAKMALLETRGLGQDWETTQVHEGDWIVSRDMGGWLYHFVVSKWHFDWWYETADLNSAQVASSLPKEAHNLNLNSDANKSEQSAPKASDANNSEPDDRSCCSEFVTREGREIHQNLEHEVFADSAFTTDWAERMEKRLVDIVNGNPQNPDSANREGE